MKTIDEIQEEVANLTDMLTDIEDHLGYVNGAFISGVIAGLLNSVATDDFLYSEHFKEKLENKLQNKLQEFK